MSIPGLPPYPSMPGRFRPAPNSTGSIVVSPHTRSAVAVRCDADPHCRRAVCFRIRLHTQSGEVLGQSADVCADHLGGLVQELARAARAEGFSDGYLQVCAITPGTVPSPVSLPFASIALAS